MDYDCYFFTLTKYLMLSGGIWPASISNIYQRYFYAVYSIFIQSYFVVFVATLTLECAIQINSLDAGERANSMTFVLVYLLTVWKIFVLKKKPILKLMYQIVVLEKSLKNKNHELEKMYRRYSVHNFKIGSVLPITTGLCGVFMCSVFYSNSLELKQLEAQGLGNQKKFLIPQRVPYTETIFYFYYWNQMFCGILGAIYIVCVDSLMVSLIVFATLRMKLLGKEFDGLFQDTNGNCVVNMKQLRDLILEHKDIISHVEELNKNFKFLFFVDFSIKSYQLCLTMFNIFEVTDVPILWAAFNISESFVLIVQVVVMYSQANEVSVESVELATSIYKIEWSDQPIAVTRCLLIMMIRAQRSLQLKSYGIVTLSSDLLLKVVKAGYTYIVLSLNNNRRTL